MSFKSTEGDYCATWRKEWLGTFGQWSLGKAKAAARREVMKLNAQLGNSSELADNDASSSSGYSSSSSEEEEEPPSICTLTDDTKKQQPRDLKGKFDMEEESTK